MPTGTSTLSDAQMAVIRGAILGARTPIEALVGALRATYLELGAPEGKPEKPSDYTLDASQSQTICIWLLERGAELGPIERVNLALEWADRGPRTV